MGGGMWSTDVYSAAAAYRARTNRSAFDYSDSTSHAPRSSWKVHDSLDPHGITRESRDSDEHPDSLPISVLFDVTGSMGSVPRTLQTKLPELFGLLMRKGYVTHPQVMFGAVGDATCDRVPLQVGQFESDNRLDDQLANIFLEGGGGGQMSESYELMMYFMARHTQLDSFDKRGQKGYLFLIGDELPYAGVKPREVKRLIGDDISEPISTEGIIAELQERFEVFFIIPAGAYHAQDPRVLQRWKGLLGQNVIELDDLAMVCETVAVTVGLDQGRIDLERGLRDLDDLGSDARGVVGKALAHRQRTTLVDVPVSSGTDQMVRL